jgi:hypothetical protein
MNAPLNTADMYSPTGAEGTSDAKKQRANRA